MANDTVVRPDQGWMLLRRGATLSFALLGQVPPTDAKVLVAQGGQSFVSLLPIQQTFSEFPLQALLPNRNSNAASPLSGDYVRLWSGAAWINYYYNGAAWFRVGAGDSSNAVLLKPGRPIYILRPTGTGSDILTQTKTY